MKKLKTSKKIVAFSSVFALFEWALGNSTQWNANENS